MGDNLVALGMGHGGNLIGNAWILKEVFESYFIFHFSPFALVALNL